MQPSSEHDNAAPTPDPALRTSRTSVTMPANLHARPAGKLAQAAARFTSTIRIGYAGKTANPTGVLAVMALGATAGTVVTVHAEGEDAVEAVRAIAQILTDAE